MTKKINRNPLNRSIQIRPWNKTKNEAHQIFKVMETCYPLFPKAKPDDQLTVLAKHVEGFEEAIHCVTYHDEIIGFATLNKDQADQPSLMCAVLPTMRARGVGEQLLHIITTYLKQNNHEILNSFTFASSKTGIRFLETHHFTVVDRVCWTRRTLSDPLPDWVMNKVRLIQQSNIRVINGVDLESLRSHWAEAWWKLQTSVLRDVPSSIPFCERPFEEWRAYIDPPFTYRENVLFAVIDQQLVGSLRLGELNGDAMNINHTGVDREYRRQGVSVLLKQMAFDLAQSHGATVITTQNHINNPMLALNLRMGFKIQDERIDYINHL